MKKVAYLFPGQGSQYAGMGKDIIEQYKEADVLFQKADESLGFSLSRIILEGPEETLKQTHYTQPALLTTSYALYTVAKNRLPKADYVLGHSLGEYTALVAAGSLSFEQAVGIVHKRGQFMNEAVPSGQGAMAAVLGGTREMIKEVCEQVQEVVEPANFNCPGQVVISGTAEGVQEATVLLKEKGIKRVIPLPVSGPFHSSLMKPAADNLEALLQTIEITTSQTPVVQNVDATPRTKGNELKKQLVHQVASSVLWEDSIDMLLRDGVDTFIEIGPGKVLTGLVKKISKDVSVYNISDVNSLEKTIHELNIQE